MSGERACPVASAIIAVGPGAPRGSVEAHVALEYARSDDLSPYISQPSPDGDQSRSINLTSTSDVEVLLLHNWALE